MAALCWWCALGIARIRNVTTDPLGTCWKCHVFACGGHAEWDRGAGKWLCLSSAAQALAAGAGLPEVDDDVAIRSPASSRVACQHWQREHGDEQGSSPRAAGQEGAAHCLRHLRREQTNRSGARDDHLVAR